MVLIKDRLYVDLYDLKTKLQRYKFWWNTNLFRHKDANHIFFLAYFSHYCFSILYFKKDY